MNQGVQAQLDPRHDQRDTHPSDAVENHSSPGPNGEDFVAFLQAEDTIDDFAASRATGLLGHSGIAIEDILIDLGLIAEEPLADALSRFLCVPRLHRNDYPAGPIAWDFCSKDHLARSRLIPLDLNDQTIQFATPCPISSQDATALGYFWDRKVVLSILTRSEFDALFDELYADPLASSSGEKQQAGTDVSFDDLDRLRDIASEAPIVRLAARLIKLACDQGASDIHVEPFEDRVRVRFRIDGHLRTIETFERQLLPGLISRFKILAKLNIAESRLPQDGRIKLPVKGRQIDFRVSSMPTLFGESLVLRILDKSDLSLSFPALGFSSQAVDQLTSLIESPNGIVLVTGPTGSGKTTSLYAALTLLNSDDRKIFTVEDPIEYNLPGINQIQINPHIGLDFARTLRSILRQDPDVIMIGEIRDPETARIAVQASLTGHLVLATVHTNSAAEAISRLTDMGIEHYLLASTIRGVMSQRLARKLCHHCSRPAPISAELAHSAGLSMTELADQGKALARTPVGCDLCKNSGYRGRTVIYEIIEFTPQLQELITRDVSARKLQAAAVDAGTRLLRECGLVKAVAGETTFEEVLKLTTDV